MENQRLQTLGVCVFWMLLVFHYTFTKSWRGYIFTPVCLSFCVYGCVSQAVYKIPSKNCILKRCWPKVGTNTQTLNQNKSPIKWANRLNALKGKIKVAECNATKSIHCTPQTIYFWYRKVLLWYRYRICFRLDQQSHLILEYQIKHKLHTLFFESIKHINHLRS